MSPRIDQLLNDLTLKEQISLLSGEDFWSLPPVQRLGIGKLRMTDGPNGARGSGSLFGTVPSAAFPVGIALGATWNPDLVNRIGAALAEEAKSKNAHLLLGPTINLHRSVTNGRNFECYSEDPVLTARLAFAYVSGLQADGVGAVVKHFVGNESEIERTTMSSEIDERTLRELYLVPFEFAVKEAGTWGVMSSYNRLNGVYTSENEWLLTTVLRKEWNYDGVVVSDWFGSHSSAPTINAGLDLEMPGPARDRGDKLVAEVEAGTVSRETLRERVANVLRLMERVHALDAAPAQAEKADDRPEHRALIREAGAESIVLLKNNGILPLTALPSVAVIGPNAKEARIMGGGSAQLSPHYRVNPWDGLVSRLGAERVSHAVGVSNHRWEPLVRGPIEASYFATNDLTGPVVYRETLPQGEAFLDDAEIAKHAGSSHWSARLTRTYTPAKSGTYRVGIVAAGLARVLVDGKLVADAWSHWKRGRTFFEEGCDEVVGTIDLVEGKTYELTVEFARKSSHVLQLAAFRLGIGLPIGQTEFDEALALAREADVAILCVGRSEQWDTEGSDLLDVRLPGRQDELVAAVAAVNPNTVVVLQTGGPVEMPWLSDVAAVVEAWYPGQEAGNAIADVLFGDADPGGRLPQTFPARWADNPTHAQDAQIYPGVDGKVRYEEGVFIGYRHYEARGIAPLFSFGFGLSYTTFVLDGLEVDSSKFESSCTLAVRATVRNTGTRFGSEVIRLYVRDEKSAVPRPPRELKGFSKVHLKPGEQAPVVFRLSPRDFAYFDDHTKGWVVEPGAFTISLVSSLGASVDQQVSRAKGMSWAV